MLLYAVGPLGGDPVSPQVHPGQSLDYYYILYLLFFFKVWPMLSIYLFTFGTLKLLVWKFLKI